MKRRVAMRHDMKDVIIDTGRKKYSNYRLRGAESFEYEVYPYGEDFEKEIILRVRKKRREYDWEFSDRLSPLFAWVRKRHGKKWDDVYSEFCAKVDSRNIRGWHVKRHLLDYVDPHGKFDRFWRNSGLTRWPFVDDEGYLRVHP
jgi:hypothetical protein